MARKRNQGAFEDMVEIISFFPWWIGVVLALISYFWLHHIAAAPLEISVQPGQVGTAITQSMTKGLATAGQYIVPLICALGALASMLGRMKRKQLISNVTQSSSIDALNGMTWHEFEMLVGEAFRRTGYSVVETGGGGADGGGDGLAGAGDAAGGVFQPGAIGNASGVGDAGDGAGRRARLMDFLRIHNEYAEPGSSA